MRSKIKAYGIERMAEHLEITPATMKKSLSKMNFTVSQLFKIQRVLLLTSEEICSLIE